MGAMVSVIHAMSCQDCARYVCNAMDLRSRCCNDCWSCEYHTELVDVPDDSSEISVEVIGCCTARSK
jgi:hypothetical protein